MRAAKTDFIITSCDKTRTLKIHKNTASSAEVKNAWSYTSTPQIRLHGVVLSQAQGQLYLYIYLYLYLSLYITVRLETGDNSQKRRFIAKVKGTSRFPIPNASEQFGGYFAPSQGEQSSSE
jgi:hypothetical protein